jgi:hypothetical protein
MTAYLHLRTALTGGGLPGRVSSRHVSAIKGRVSLAAGGGRAARMRRLRFVSMAILAATVLCPLAACKASTTASGTAGPTAGGTSPAGKGSSTATAVASGTVSTDGVCGLVPIASVDSILGRAYVNSKLVAIPAITMADASYCDYTPASGGGEFQIQIATSAPADATDTMNEATGGRLKPVSGIGDSALFTAFFPELVVVYGQTTIAVSQSSSGAGNSPITQGQLKTLATAVHAAA